MAVIEVNPQGSTSIVVDVEGGPTIQTSTNESLVVSALAGIRGETGRSGFLVETDAGYPTRPVDLVNATFYGSTNPDTLGLMRLGDTWINTAVDPNQVSPYVRGDVDAPVLRTNLHVNPTTLLNNGVMTGYTGTGNNVLLSLTNGPALSGAPTSASAQVQTDATGTYQGIGIRFTAVAGRTYSFSFWVQANPEQYTLTIYGPNGVQGFPNTKVNVPSTPVLVTNNFTSTQTGETTIYFSSGSKNIATMINVAAPVIVEGTSPVAYFDGDSPGCRWTGTKYLSTSEKLLSAVTDTLHVQSLPTVATNYIVNPTVKLDVNNWSPIATEGGSPVRLDDPSSPSGDASAARKTASGNATGMGMGAYTKDALQPGQYVLSYWVRSSAALTWQHYPEGEASTSLSPRSVGYSLASNVWTRIIVPTTVTTPGTMKVGGYLQGASGNVSAGTTLDMTGVMCTPGTMVHPFFSGETPGCRWVSKAYNSASIKYLEPSFDAKIGARNNNSLLLPDYTQTSGWKFSSALYLEGTGSPEGVQTAPVGSRYIDTATTNGAVEWIKAYGTGNTGWKVVYGDTGFRSLPLINGWSGTVVVRRVNETLYWKYSLNAASATSGQFIAGPPPAGFRGPTPASINQGRPLLHLSNGNTATSPTIRRMYDMITVFAYTASDVLYGDFVNMAEEGWPSSLPGTPAT